MPRSPNAVLSLLPAGPKAVGSQTSAGMCRGSRGPAHQASRKRVYVEREEDVVLPSDVCSRPHGGASAAGSQPRIQTKTHASPSALRRGRGALAQTARALPACFGAVAYRETLRGGEGARHTPAPRVGRAAAPRPLPTAGPPDQARSARLLRGRSTPRGTQRGRATSRYKVPSPKSQAVTKSNNKFEIAFQ